MRTLLFELMLLFYVLDRQPQILLELLIKPSNLFLPFLSTKRILCKRQSHKAKSLTEIDTMTQNHLVYATSHTQYFAQVLGPACTNFIWQRDAVLFPATSGFIHFHFSKMQWIIHQLHTGGSRRRILLIWPDVGKSWLACLPILGISKSQRFGQEKCSMSCAYISS